MIPREELTSPDAVGQPVLDRRFGVAALCPDSGDEEGEIRHLLAEILEFLGLGRADDESDVVVFVPEIRQRGHSLVDGLAGLEFEVL